MELMKNSVAYNRTCNRLRHISTLIHIHIKAAIHEIISISNLSKKDNVNILKI